MLHHPVTWECHELCVLCLAHAGFRYGHALKRSSNMIANRFRAANHSRTFLPPFSKLRIAKVNQLGRGLLGRERAAGLDRFAE